MFHTYSFLIKKQNKQRKLFKYKQKCPKFTEVNEQSSGNFTCTATNSIAEDSIVYTVKVVMPPGAPALSLQYTTATSIKLHWRIPETDQPVLGKKYMILLWMVEDSICTWMDALF